jgi:outer membrane immunogenic protein
MVAFRRIGLTAAAVFAIGGTAIAADIPIKAPIYTKAPPVWTWDGWYIGAHAGYAFGDYNLDFFGVAAIGTEPKGAFGGIQIGYLRHISPNWVLGFEVDISAGDVSGDLAGGLATFDVDYFGTARTRLGYAHGPWLFYGTAGAAWANTTFSSPIGFSAEFPYVGYAVGAGIEYAFAPNWSARLEYLYADLGEIRFNIGGAAVVSELQMSTVRLAVNYRFADFRPAVSAAAFPTKAPVYAGFDWSGVYIGLHGGYADGDQEFALGGVGGLTIGSRGWLGGFQSGANWQFARNWVIGIEGDSSWGSIDGNFAGVLNHETKSLGTARLRLGYAHNNWLVYGTAGAAWAEAEFSVPGLVSFERYFLGWAAGAGVEYAFSPRWSVKLEYMRYEFNDNEITFGGVGIADRLSQDVVRVGVNYRASLLELLTSR